MLEVGHPESGFVQSERLIFDDFGGQIQIGAVGFGWETQKCGVQGATITVSFPPPPHVPCNVGAVGLELSRLFNRAVPSLLLSASAGYSG